MTATKLLSDNGVISGITGYQLTGGNDGTLQLQTTTAGGTATTALTLGADQTATFASSITGTTAAQFDNSTKVATTAFTQRALGAWSGVSAIGGNTTIDASYANKVLRVDATATLNFTPSSFAVGTRFMVIGNGATGTLTSSTGSFISYGVNTLSSVSVTNGNGISLFWDGGNLIMENISLNQQAQSWTDVTASRAFTVTYTNTSGKPLTVFVWAYSGGTNGNKQINGYVNGVLIAANGFYTTTGNNYPSVTFTVPAGATYGADTFGSNVTISLSGWREFK